MRGSSDASSGGRRGRVVAVVIVGSLAAALAAIAALRTQPIPIEVRAEVIPAGGAGKGPEDLRSTDVAQRCFHAREGGQLALPEHGGVLHVPVGALPLESCMSLIAERASRRGIPSQFRIEPEGIVFDPPAVFELDFGGFRALAPWLVPSPVLDEHIGPSEIEGNTLRFDVYRTGELPIWVETADTPDGCAIKPKHFRACGGALEGRWQLEGLCYDDLRTIAYEGPADEPPRCAAERAARPPDDVFVHTLVDGVDQWAMTAKLVVRGDRFERTVAKPLITLKTKHLAACYTPRTCEAVSRLLFSHPNGCTGTTTCECRFAVPTSLPAIEARLTVEGSRLRIEGRAAADYCVGDDRLRVRHELHGEPVVEVYRRL
jgi:hypothetical protein